jgi:hypothetical protein
MSRRQGIPDAFPIYLEIGSALVVTIWKQGSAPHPNPLDRFSLYLRVEQRWVYLGEKTAIRTDADLQRWVRQSVQRHLRDQRATRKKIGMVLATVDSNIEALEAVKAAVR